MRHTPLALILGAALLASPALNAETLSAAPPSTSVTQLTENEARSRIEEIGYTQVSDLRLGDGGLWQGSASRNGDPRPVRLDAQGNLEDPWELAALTMFDSETHEPRESGAPSLVQQISR